MNTKFFDRPLVLPALLVGGAIVIAFVVGLGLVGWGISARGAGDTISVTGSAQTDAVSDTATWTIDLRRSALEGSVAAATEGVTRDGQAVMQYLSGQNLASSTVTASTVSINQDYSYSPDKNGGPTSYDVAESVTVSTSDVNAVDKLSHGISALDALVSAATIVSPEQPQYYLSSLPGLRVSLLGAAVQDARARADAIAESGGSSVGPLASASSGVVQVLAPNSTNVEDYGEYDTSTIQKTVMVTAHATFYVR